MQATIKNLDYFRNSPKLVLNVLSGGPDWSETKFWYDSVKSFSHPSTPNFFRGYSMSGDNVGNFKRTLKMLIHMRDDGLLTPEHRHLHMLGTSRLHQGWTYHLLQDVINTLFTANNGFTITFDAASPYLLAVNGQVYIQKFIHDLGRWRYRSTHLRPPRSDMSMYDYFLSMKWDTSDVLKHFSCNDMYNHIDPKTKEPTGRFGGEEMYFVYAAHNVYTFMDISTQVEYEAKWTLNVPGQLVDMNCADVMLNNDLFDVQQHSHKLNFIEQMHKALSLPINEAMDYIDKNFYFNNLSWGEGFGTTYEDMF